MLRWEPTCLADRGGNRAFPWRDRERESKERAALTLQADPICQFMEPAVGRREFKCVTLIRFREADIQRRIRPEGCLPTATVQKQGTACSHGEPVG